MADELNNEETPEERNVRVLDMIITDIDADIRALESKPFTGRSVGDMFGKQAAAISALANIIKSQLTKGE